MTGCQGMDAGAEQWVMRTRSEEIMVSVECVGDDGTTLFLRGISFVLGVVFLWSAHKNNRLIWNIRIV